jgi:hypothetical protein
MLLETNLNSSDPWLTFRCRFALLRALRFLEHCPFKRGDYDLIWLLCEIVELVPQGPPEVPWPLRDEPVLAALYEASLATFKLCKLQFDTEEEERLERYRYMDSETPTAEACLLELVAGNKIMLAGHDLSWDDDFGGLAGTNGYGQEYFWGEMDLPSVERWRTGLISGKQYGLCDEAGYYDFDTDSYEVGDRHDFESLEEMYGVMARRAISSLIPNDCYTDD